MVGSQPLPQNAAESSFSSSCYGRINRCRAPGCVTPSGPVASAIAGKPHAHRRQRRPHYLREVLGGSDALRCTSEGYGWHPIIRLQSDLASFTRLYDEGSGAALREAMSLYRGELFEGDDVTGSNPHALSSPPCTRPRSSGSRGPLLKTAVMNAPFNTGSSCWRSTVRTRCSRLVMRSFGAVGRRGRVLAEYQALHTYLRLPPELEPIRRPPPCCKKSWRATIPRGGAAPRAAR